MASNLISMGERLTPVSTVKYLGILLDEHLLWTKKVNQVNSKLNGTIRILSKLTCNTSLNILKTFYHSLFRSHQQYGTQLQGQENFVNRNNIRNFQNQGLRKIAFKRFHDPVKPLYKDLKILKLKDLLHLQNSLFVLQFEQLQILEKSFVEIKHYGDNHNYQTLASTKRPLGTPLYKANTHSVKYHCILD